MSPILKGNKSNLVFKRKMRIEMPEPEKRLWNKLCFKQFHGCKFRRQHGIGPYIVDFYCPSKKFVIEVDGETHYEGDRKDRDNERDEHLNSLSLKVVRYTNYEVMNNLEGVMQDIETQLFSDPTSPSPLLTKEGE